MSTSSTSPPDPVLEILDALITDVRSTFHAFLLAQTTLQLGGNVLKSIQDSAIVEATLGVALSMEPISIGELRQYSTTFPTFLLDVFHSKIVQHWQDCLTKIFCHYVDLHVTGTRPFAELRAKNVRIDFASTDPVNDQLRASLVRDFAFSEYAERQKLINNLRNATGKYPEDLSNIHKHVLIRNAAQHRHGVVDAYTLKRLGKTKVKVLDATGAVQQLGEGDRIELSIPELDSFRRSILLVGQAWRS